ARKEKKARRLGMPGDDVVGVLDALVADVDVRTGDELGNLARRPTTERADGVALDGARAPDARPPRAARFADDLLDPLMAEAERLGDFAQGAAGQVETADGRVVLG